MAQKEERDPKEYYREEMSKKSSKELLNRKSIFHGFKSPLLGGPLMCLDPLHSSVFQVISEEECECIQNEDQEAIIH